MLLGKKVSYSEKYDSSLLFRIDRSTNRKKYKIARNSLPFSGFDVWNCYELSFLTQNGLPLQRVMKLIYPAESQYIVESKSLKLYLNSFSFEKFADENDVKTTITNDLQQLLETEVNVCFFDKKSKTKVPFSEIDKDLSDLISKEDLQNIEFENHKEKPELLQSEKTETLNYYSFHCDLLRSNCPVTNQPDFGDLFVKISTSHKIDFCSVLRYIVSFRKENHFHEEVVEMIYKRFLDIFETKSLMVAAMYTRRGGIDINPIRVSDISLIDKAFTTKTLRMSKTLRQ